MKLIPMLLLTAASALASNVGDTYQQVVAERGEPKSQIEAGAVRVLNYPDATIRIRDNAVISIKAIVAAPQPTPPSPTPTAPLSPQAQITALKRQLNDAMTRVQNIVNQPVAPVQRTPEMRVELFGPPWFHPGAGKPDFNNIDIRTTQETPYDRYPYVSSELNPGLAWVGSDLEFNANTKIFYSDRTVPKKKLTEDEMLEINRLYRIIGHCEQELIHLQANAR
ncbi:MAG TPA: hypothetical protein VKG78_09970 [Opitutaceae bacterium]|nr:hypothetical protein [Opitutaceae bacterium]